MRDTQADSKSREGGGWSWVFLGLLKEEEHGFVQRVGHFLHEKSTHSPAKTQVSVSLYYLVHPTNFNLSSGLLATLWLLVFYPRSRESP